MDCGAQKTGQIWATMIKTQQERHRSRMLMAAASLLQECSTDQATDKTKPTYKLVCWRSGKIYFDRVLLLKYDNDLRTLQWIGELAHLPGGTWARTNEEIQQEIADVGL